MVTSAKSIHSLLDRPDIAAERGRMLSAERREEAFSQFSGGPTEVFGCEGPESAKAHHSDATAYGRGSGGRGRKSGRRGGRISRLGGVQEGSAYAEGDGEEEAVETEVNGTKGTGEHL